MTKRFRTTRVVRNRRPLGKKILSRRPRMKNRKLNIYDAKEASDMGAVSSSAVVTVDAGKYGLSAKMIDLQTWDQWNSAKAEILKSKFKVLLASTTTNANLNAAVVLVQYTGNAPADRVDLAQTESIGTALATQFAGLSYKYRILKAVQGKQVPDPVTSGHYLSRVELDVPVNNIWKQIEKFCGEQTGMSLMPDNKFGLWLVCKTTAAMQIRTFTSYEKHFKFRSSKDIGL